jgi:hypothetical protein
MNMGTLSLNVGNVQASREIDNAKLLAVANLIYDYHVAPNLSLTDLKALPKTPQEKLQAVLDWNAEHLRDLAREAKRRELAVQHGESDADAIAGIDI